ncbi:Arf GTPase activating protein [Reticulomyxa filosa]|uniref:Arf GTPase activating protein n=1 Tax=Reticulomyxa filosa TaxID=46433 RepID=X6M7U6_RETFI|nr:Arf GTPase activating protein [Reticulomyxa filosa]|eukprot:ETO09105.1 Arf GTPase activating protein [Reticulomyxa filosa]
MHIIGYVCNFFFLFHGSQKKKKVKSATLDLWTPELIQHFKRQGGNIVVNHLYEATLPKRDKPTEEVDVPRLEQFIRAKYEAKKWYALPRSENASNLSKGKDKSQNNQPTTQSNANSKMASKTGPQKMIKKVCVKLLSRTLKFLVALCFSWPVVHILSFDKRRDKQLYTFIYIYLHNKGEILKRTNEPEALLTFETLSNTNKNGPSEVGADFSALWANGDVSSSNQSDGTSGFAFINNSSSTQEIRPLNNHVSSAFSFHNNNLSSAPTTTNATGGIDILTEPAPTNSKETILSMYKKQEQLPLFQKIDPKSKVFFIILFYFF